MDGKPHIRFQVGAGGQGVRVIGSEDPQPIGEQLLERGRRAAGTSYASRAVEAEGSLIREVPEKVASGPDKAVTRQHRQMVWVRRAWTERSTRGTGVYAS